VEEVDVVGDLDRSAAPRTPATRARDSRDPEATVAIVDEVQSLVLLLQHAHGGSTLSPQPAESPVCSTVLGR
jgi:hypothetical protein